MKALSIRQPYADLIASGIKTIELRNWKAPYRGPFLIHASKIVDLEACKRLKVASENLVTGAAIGKAKVIDMKIYTTEKEFLKDKNKHLIRSLDNRDIRRTVGYIINNAKRFKKPVPMAGQLYFFDVLSSTT